MSLALCVAWADAQSLQCPDKMVNFPGLANSQRENEGTHCNVCERGTRVWHQNYTRGAAGLRVVK